MRLTRSSKRKGAKIGDGDVEAKIPHATDEEHFTDAVKGDNTEATMRPTRQSKTKSAKKGDGDAVESEIPSGAVGDSDILTIMKPRTCLKRNCTLIADGDAGEAKIPCANIEKNLSEAVKGGDLGLVRELFKKHCDCSSSYKIDKYTLQSALRTAVNDGKKHIVQLLLQNFVRPESSMLVNAVKKGFPDIVRVLTRAGALVEKRDIRGKTALMYAVQQGNLRVVSHFLRECSANPNAQDKCGKTALMMSVELCDYKNVALLVETGRCDYGIKDKNNNTIFDLAEKNESRDLLDIIIKGKESRLPPLILAAASKNFELVEKLLLTNTDLVKKHSKDNLTPLTAAMGGLCQDGETDLTSPCNPKLLSMLIKNGADVNTPHPRSVYTPLMYAAEANQLVIVKLLIEYEADIDKYDTICFQTPLMIAAHRGASDICDVLLFHKANHRLVDHKGDSALEYALRARSRKSVSSLLTKWGKLTYKQIDMFVESEVLESFIDARDRWRFLLSRESAAKLLDIAIEKKQYLLVEILLTDIRPSGWVESPELILELVETDMKMLHVLLRKGVRVDYDSVTCYTALMLAASRGQLDAIDKLLELKADINTEVCGATALTLASYNGREEVVQKLLDLNMDINHVTKHGQSALSAAVCSKNLSLTEMLLERGANVNIMSTFNQSMLMIAVQSCHIEFLELLIEHGADIHARDHFERTALMYAYREADGESKISLLLENGADVKSVAESCSKNTPLIFAAQYCTPRALQMLLTHGGADIVNAQNLSGSTAMHWALGPAGSQSGEKLKILVDHGADVNIFNMMCRTPLMEAITALNDECVKILINSGADVHFSSSESEREIWNDFIEEVLSRCEGMDSSQEKLYKHLRCIEPVLDAGCSLSHVPSPILRSFFAKCIGLHAPRILYHLMQSGMSPCLNTRKDTWTALAQRFMWTNFNTDMCLAIINRKVDVVALFMQADFYHPRDFEMLQTRYMRQKVDELIAWDWMYTDLALPKLLPNSWSLSTLSTLAVNKAIGFDESRESRVRALPIPKLLQDKLLFRGLNLPESIFKYKHCFR